MGIMNKVVAYVNNKFNDLPTRSLEKYYGAIPVEKKPGFDSYNAIMDALNDCEANGYELTIGRGTYEYGTEIIHPGANWRISGVSSQRSILKCTKPGVDCIKLGPGASGSTGMPAGFLQDFAVLGPTAHPDNKKAALALDGLRHLTLKRLRAANNDIGFDPRNNCFGLQLDHCVADMANVNVAVLLRGSNNADGSFWGSGSDIQFNYCWMSGIKAAYWMHRDSGGYHINNGQMSCGGTGGLGADNDLWGCMVIGVDYEDGVRTGAVGNVSVEGVDIEGYHNTWAFRGFGEVNLYVDGSSFLGTDENATTRAMSLIKVTNPGNGRIKLRSNNVQGTFSQTKPLDIVSPGSAFLLDEDNTSFGPGTTFNGVAASTGKTLAEISSLSAAVANGRTGGNAFTEIGQLRIRHIGSRVDVSFDRGATWKQLGPIQSGTTASRPTANLYTGLQYYDTDLNKVIVRNAANNAWTDIATGATV